MKYANWMSENDLKSYLKENITGGQIPLLYDQETSYSINIGNTLVIGAPGSGKTQSILLPTLRKIIKNNESVVVNDPKGELIKETEQELKENNYNILEITFENQNTKNKWNPFSLPIQLYKENKKDEAIDMIKAIMTTLLQEKKQTGDPFWTISCIDLATGTALYLLENNKELTLKEIYKTAQILTKDDLKELDKTSSTYCFLTGTLSAPEETKGSILSTFNQKIINYVTKESLQNTISTTDFDITTIKPTKTALFITNSTSEISNTLVPELINQIIKAVEIYNQKNNKLNIILDEFDEMSPLKNYSKILTNSRQYNINNLITIKGFLTLENKYTKEDIELIEMCISNLIYLYSKDINTLKKISMICGNVSKDEPLITVEELQRLKQFEAIIKLPRLDAIKLQLVPDFKIK